MGQAPGEKPRGIISTFFVALFFSVVGGFLWIGRPRLAFAAFAASSAVVASILSLGLPPSLGAIVIDWLPLMTVLIGIAAVLAFRPYSVPKGVWSAWYTALFAGLVVPLIAVEAFRSFAFQPYSIPAGSMQPTLTVGDQVVASKFTYGYSRYSFPLAEMLPIDGRISPTDPERGDIVTFKHPQDTRQDYIKRVIGLPGDAIQMIDGKLHINGEAVERKLVRRAKQGVRPYEHDAAAVYLETLPNDVAYFTLDLSPNSIGDNTRVYEVPERHYFMMGDNRDNSLDSRFNMGFVPFENIIGRAGRIFGNNEGLDYRCRRDLRTLQECVY